MPAETELVNVKLIIQSEESTLQKVEEGLNRAQYSYEESLKEVDRLKADEIAVICERFDTQIQQMTISWKQKEAEFKVQMKEIEERLARRREFVAPVKRLPSEVLSDIFTILVDCGDTPWTLLRVCRLWKAVTSSTPRIWRYIQIAGDQGQFNSGTSFQNCFTNEHFEKALSRTGAAPLNISLTLPPCVMDTAADSHRIFALFGTLTTVLNRCDTLELKEGRRSFSAKYQELFATLQFPISSSLRCLRLGSGWEDLNIVQKLLVASNHQSAALRELSMTSYGVPSLVDSLSKYRILLKRLTSFSANGFEVPKDAFAAMYRLSYFSQTYGNFVPSQAPGVSDLLQEARFIRVNLLELYGHQFSNLKKLVLRGCPMAIGPGAVKVPVLDTLVFQNSSWLPILVFDCPSLSHLELEEGPYSKAVAKREVNQIWVPQQRFIHLKALKITLVMNDAVLVATLKRLVALELLSIEFPGNVKSGTAPGDTFFNSLLVKNSQRPGFLQNLRTLILQSKFGYSKSGSLIQGLRTNIQRAVRSRQRLAPLRVSLLLMRQQWWLGSEIDGGFEIDREEFVACGEEQ